jgi:putative effector of murein hydrolase LrgA (UPF0299 family)
MSGADEFAAWFVGSFVLALLIPIAVAVGLYFVLRKTFRLNVLWSIVISTAAVVFICALIFAR